MQAQSAQNKQARATSAHTKPSELSKLTPCLREIWENAAQAFVFFDMHCQDFLTKTDIVSCVCERETDRERERVCVCVCVYFLTCMVRTS